MHCSPSSRPPRLLRRVSALGKFVPVLPVLILCSTLRLLGADASEIPEWEYPGAYPGAPTHQQHPPPADFRRQGRNFDTPIGVFTGQSEIGGMFVPTSASFDPTTGKYTVTSAGYNIWYTRDEFRYLWTKMSGDVSLAADINILNTNNFGDCKAVLIIRQSLDDDSKEALATLHGAGMIALAWRPEKGVRVKDMEYGRLGGRGRNPSSPDSLVTVTAKRIGIEKRGDDFAIYVSLEGEPMHQFGPPITLHLDAPFYVGLGFCSHQPDKADTAVFSNVVLKNSFGEVK